MFFFSVSQAVITSESDSEIITKFGCVWSDGSVLQVVWGCVLSQVFLAPYAVTKQSFPLCTKWKILIIAGNSLRNQEVTFSVTSWHFLYKTFDIAASEFKTDVSFSFIFTMGPIAWELTLGYSVPLPWSSFRFINYENNHCITQWAVNNWALSKSKSSFKVILFQMIILECHVISKRFLRSSEKISF